MSTGQVFVQVAPSLDVWGEKHVWYDKGGKKGEQVVWGQEVASEERGRVGGTE